jgi:NAD+ kinase
MMVQRRTAKRRVLLVAHPRRQEAHDLAAGVAERLHAAGMEVALLPEEAVAMGLEGSTAIALADPEAPAQGCELVCVLGGDGTILRGAELSRGTDAPLLGVNLGHVGFLAEAEREDIGATVDHIVARSYVVEERLTLDVHAMVDGEPVCRSWALNEVTVEKASRERMLEVTLEIDGRPLSTWGCDGVVMATPTGSTAYAFSAGGPVVWPDVEAMLLVPISAHALFARPLVVGPTSRLAVEVIPDNLGSGVLWCDGRRAVDLPPGARIEVVRSDTPVRLARPTSSPFTDRLVAKFDLSIHGWRGSARRGLKARARARGRAPELRRGDGPGAGDGAGRGEGNGEGNGEGRIEGQLKRSGEQPAQERGDGHRDAPTEAAPEPGADQTSAPARTHAPERPHGRARAQTRL